MDLDVHLPEIARGDASAFAAWLAHAEAPVRRSLASFAGTVDVEAVLQEALLRTWQVAPKVRPDGRPNALLRLALRIARNAAIDEVRRARVVPMDAADLQRQLDAEGVEVAPPDPLLREALETCRGKLPAQPGKAMNARLAASAGRTDRELAASVDMQLNTFLKNVGRARRFLVECLARAGVILEIT
ncbi:MAG: sigma-70 family RNA polymerase sigma factor [Myxococcales bacterium]|nr:sigma-70 family RNA polymerase sigma factor [Myxococcales bacterium]